MQTNMVARTNGLSEAIERLEQAQAMMNQKFMEQQVVLDQISRNLTQMMLQMTPGQPLLQQQTQMAAAQPQQLPPQPQQAAALQLPMPMDEFQDARDTVVRAAEDNQSHHDEAPPTKKAGTASSATNDA